MKNKRILFLTKYTRIGASSRYRTFQYLPYLDKAGVPYKVAPLFGEDYLKSIYTTKRHNPVNVIKYYIKRIFYLLTAKNYDILFIEGELLPYFPGILEKILSYFQIPYILDYDDATFTHYKNMNFSFINLFVL